MKIGKRGNMKKIINTPEGYTDDMLRGIYEAHKGKGKPDQGAYAFSVMMRGMNKYIRGEV